MFLIVSLIVLLKRHREACAAVGNQCQRDREWKRLLHMPCRSNLFDLKAMPHMVSGLHSCLCRKQFLSVTSDHSLVSEHTQRLLSRGILKLARVRQHERMENARLFIASTHSSSHPTQGQPLKTFTRVNFSTDQPARWPPESAWKSSASDSPAPNSGTFCVVGTK